MSQLFTDSIVVPVANQADATTTAAALEPYDIGEITVMYVVEKGDGVPDKTPVEQSEQIATESFAAFREAFPTAETETIYRRDVVTAISEVAREIDASAIVFHPRGGSRFRQFLTGDRSLRLITEAERPVIALPNEVSEA
ncbi:universal stress protein [Halocatena pleomorpha]|uniref:Universal stress protein n=1 Tax=Halocatena pleomorpha TaxID=1785090 RepID=A0A3P3RDA8_9EURY|nr:universal stress protein [Halocatena pleomorpha]RRJ31472.1 universal stress protein [Halocatena pleomorpha]